MAKRKHRRTRYPDDDWSEFEVTKPWEQCTTDEKWRKLAMEFHRLHMLRKGVRDSLRDKEAAKRANAAKHGEEAKAIKRQFKKRVCELLRESDDAPIPREGRRLLAELLDSRGKCFDVQLELRDKPDLEFEERRRADLEWGIAIRNEAERHGLTYEEAAKNLFDSDLFRQVKGRYKFPHPHWYRGLQAPWAED